MLREKTFTRAEVDAEVHGLRIKVGELLDEVKRLKKARRPVALEAMVEPTDEMVRAGGLVTARLPDDCPYSEMIVGGGLAADIWRAMIDAALNQSTERGS